MFEEVEASRVDPAGRIGPLLTRGSDGSCVGLVDEVSCPLESEQWSSGLELPVEWCLLSRFDGFASSVLFSGSIDEPQQITGEMTLVLLSAVVQQDLRVPFELLSDGWHAAASVSCVAHVGASSVAVGCSRAGLDWEEADAVFMALELGNGADA